ncbi:superoxide dismutase family protein [Virgibacillus halophilus]|uniref:Superoxide dismutase [Cu-Zn] n=1 Tax=Tigheibacillus halophilus TaxID=361280 RepID=A0ABU5C687_9BACI|nr:superoxide dismutase family protein [Virgibacillus halophilus]
MHVKKWMYISFVLSFSILLVACSGPKQEESGNNKQQDADIEAAAAKETAGLAARAVLVNSQGLKVGTVDMHQTDKGVEMTLKASDLPPGLHGFHIHEKGLCEAPSFESAGGHFNPTNAKHGFDAAGGPHDGDFPNLEVTADGTAEATFINDRVTLAKGKKNSLFQEGGTSFIIHAKPDDYVSQPAGDAGDRIACGEIEKMSTATSQ